MANSKPPVCSQGGELGGDAGSWLSGWVRLLLDAMAATHTHGPGYLVPSAPKFTVPLNPDLVPSRLAWCNWPANPYHCRPWEERKTYGSTLLDVFVVTVTSWECLQLSPKDEHFNVEWEFGTRKVPSCPCLVLGPSGVTWYIIPRPRVSTLTTWQKI